MLRTSIGLLSLTVEFYRIKPSACSHDDSGNPLSSDASKFPYGKAFCGLSCTVDRGPRSPMRGGSANNIYVIPAPHVLTFDTATLLAAACCIPAILSLISMWMKILELNWKSRFGDGSEDGRNDELIEGTNGATIGKMRKVNDRIRFFLSALGIPVFCGAILAILIIGERNFFSAPVRYQTEPVASIGRWISVIIWLANSCRAIHRPVGTDRRYWACSSWVALSSLCRRRSRGRETHITYRSL